MLTKVELGVRRPGEVEVVKGLTRTDMVVTDGQMKLKDGAPVMVLPPPAPAATANGAAAPKPGGGVAAQASRRIDEVGGA